MPRAARALSPPEQLRLLLPWINGEADDEQAVRHALVTFLADFHAPHLRVHADVMTREAHAWATTKALAATRATVRAVLTRACVEPPTGSDAFGRTGTTDITVPLACPSLYFGVRPGPEPDLHVGAVRVRDLVAFLLLHLLTLGEVTVGVCKAPGARTWRRRCHRVFVQQGRGRPLSFCSDACRWRYHDKQKSDELRGALRDATRATRLVGLPSRRRKAARSETMSEAMSQAPPRSTPPRAPLALSAPERLHLLLPWINGEEDDEQAVRHALVTFLEDFHTPHVRVHADAMTSDAHAWATTQDLAATRATLRAVLGLTRVDDEPPAGSDEVGRAGTEDITVPLFCPSLRFGVRPGPEPELHVGAVRVGDLVAFLLVHLLTRGEVTVTVCKAPAARRWRQRCHRVFIQQGRGRPLIFCSDACRRRHHDKRRKIERLRTR